MLDRVVCCREQFNFQMCLESDDSRICNWRQRVPDSWCDDAECFGLEVEYRHIAMYFLFHLKITIFIFTARCTIVQSAVSRLHVVCLSVTLVDQDHIGWKSWKLIARTISYTNFQFCTRIHRIDRNKSPLKISGKVAVGVVIGTPENF